MTIESYRFFFVVLAAALSDPRAPPGTAKRVTSVTLTPIPPELFADPANEVFLSVVSVWEIGVKNAAGRLPLPRPHERYIPDLRERHGIESFALDEATVLQIAKLPPRHRDPFDRMLVCQAIVRGLTILTPDPLVSQYPVPTAW